MSRVRESHHDVVVVGARCAGALLARAAGRALRDPCDEPAALRGHEEQRDLAVAETFRLTRAMAAFPPADRFVELQAELGRALDVEAGALAAQPDPVLVA